MIRVGKTNIEERDLVYRVMQNLKCCSDAKVPHERWKVIALLFPLMRT